MTIVIEVIPYRPSGYLRRVPFAFRREHDDDGDVHLDGWSVIVAGQGWRIIRYRGDRARVTWSDRP